VRVPPRPSGRVVAEDPSLQVIRVPPRPSGRVVQFWASAIAISETRPRAKARTRARTRAMVGSSSVIGGSKTRATSRAAAHSRACRGSQPGPLTVRISRHDGPRAESAGRWTQRAQNFICSDWTLSDRGPGPHLSELGHGRAQIASSDSAARVQADQRTDRQRARRQAAD
jgi:hypothetical protein